MHQLLEVTLDRKQVRRVEAILELAGATSVALVDAGTEPILEPAPGETPLWSAVKLAAVFPPEANLTPMASMLDDLVTNPPTISEIVETDWMRTSGGAASYHGRRLQISPSDTPADPDRVKVVIPEGLAFGTGHHPTTAMALEWLDRHLQKGCGVLDYGCGSGILAIAALKLGAATAHGVDIDQQALLSTRQNATNNQVARQLTVGTPDDPIRGPFEVVIANILARPIIQLATTLIQSTAPGGHLVLTGILASQLEEVERAYSAEIVNWQDDYREDWALIWGRRPD